MSFRIVVLFAVFAIFACNPRADYAIVGSAEVPSVHGDVELERIDRDQRLVTVLLDQLPAPSRVDASVTHYVVWFVVVGEDPMRQGVLEYDAETRSGRGSFPTSLDEFEVRVTAESSAEPSTPNYLLVASQQIREN